MARRWMQERDLEMIEDMEPRAFHIIDGVIIAERLRFHEPGLTNIWFFVISTLNN